MTYRDIDVNIKGMGWLKNIPLRRFLEMHGPA